jgi:hypothetical protein
MLLECSKSFNYIILYFLSMDTDLYGSFLLSLYRRGLYFPLVSWLLFYGMVRAVTIFVVFSPIFSFSKKKKKRLMRSVCCLCVPVIFSFLCDLCRNKGK